MRSGSPRVTGLGQTGGRWRLAVSSLTVVTLGTLLAACGANTSSTSKTSVTEGLMSAYTGTSSFEGPSGSAGVLPAAYIINQAGGILGHRLAVQTEDTRGDPADAAPLAEKLLATAGNLVGITGPGTNSSPTVVPIVNSAHVTEMIVGGNAEFDHSRYQYEWRLIPPDAANGVAMALWAKAKGYTRIATVFGTDSGSQGDLPGVLAGIKAIHATVVARINLTPDQATYSPQVEAVLRANPQVIMTESDGATDATFFGELKQLGHLVPIIGTNATTLPGWLGPVRGTLGPTDFAKYFTAAGAGVPRSTAANKAFSSAIKAVGSQLQSPVAQWAANPYSQAQFDGVIVQALAMTAAHSISPRVYNSYIVRVTEPGKGKSIVYTYSQGVKLLSEGKQIQYVGAVGPIVFDKYHNAYGNQTIVRIGSSDQRVVLSEITAKQVDAVG